MTRLLSAISFETPDQSYMCQRCRDTFLYKLVVKDGEKTYRVKWNDWDMVPKKLADFGALFERLISDGFKAIRAAADSTKKKL
ncbi:MAG: hypothetical protein V1495_08935 [Pseudomonadota bacterium]